nr:hypothetical protein [Tanacetum cinerariifolium]GEW84672.1 hypothetical protein [Tanacetum cinerariifolium]
MLGVKGISRVSPMKSKVTDKSDSPRRRWISLSERVSNKPSDIVVNAQHVSQYNSVTGQVIEIDKVQQPKVKSTVDEKDNPKVKPAVPKEKPAVASVVADKYDVVKAPVVTDEVLVVADKALVVKAKVADNVVADKESVKDKPKHKVSDALKNKDTDVKKKSVGKGKKSTVDKPKDNVPNPKDNKSKAHLDVVPVAEKPKPNPKQKEKSTVQELSKSKERPMKRKRIVSKEDDRKNKLKGKSKKGDSDSKLKTDVVDSSSDEVDQKRKKLKIKDGLKRKRSGSYSSDSLSIDTIKVKRLISKLEKKVKKQENDKESVPKKGVPVGGYSLFDLDEREADHEFVKLWVGQFHPVELRDLRVNDIARKLVAAKEIDILFKVIFLTLFTNTMGKADGLKGQICLDVVRRLREDSLLYLDSNKFDRFPIVRTHPAIKDWSTYLMKQRQELELKYHVLGLLDLRVEWTEDPISFDVDLDVGNDRNGDDDWNDDNDNDSDGNGVEEDVNEGDKDPNGSNPSFGFSKISLDDFHNDSGPTGIESVDPTEQETIVEVNPPEECELMSTLENYTQWLDKNADLVREGDLFGDNSTTLKAMNQEITPEKLPTQKAIPSPKKRAVKPFYYLLSPYMNKKTNVVPKITRLEFILGNSLFAMQGDKIENVFEAHFGKFIVYGVPLNLETLAPGLWLNANVIDCWGTVLNHEESFQAAQSKSKHFFPTDCISKSMFDGTLASFDAKWKSFSNQVNAQFKGNKGGLAFGGIDLYDHIRHTQVAKVKQTIPKLKWKTKENFHDCGIFTMLYMETFDGGPASNLDCGVLVESQLQCDMLRRLRFKFATKILLHEINVHVGLMLELAKEFDKTDHVEKMLIIVDAFKKRDERDCI